jgi:deazaflavin-dependent oxidoreductase (nitroreductase family)
MPDSNTSVKPWSKRQEKFGKAFIKKIARLQTFVYERSHGRIWHTFLGAPCAILSTRGRKTGELRKTPLLFIHDGQDVVMAASQGGFSSLPMWYLNLKANPSVSIQVGAVKRSMVAREAETAEKARLWPLLDEIYSGYAEYRERTHGIRDIPIIIFSPKDLT